VFYETANGHGLPHDPFKAIVAPRPIGWISTRAGDGRINLAPYSFFNAISSKPDLVMFSSDGEKDSVAFARETGEFVVNLVTRDLFDAMNTSSTDAPRGVSEFQLAGVTPAPCRLISAPRVGEAHAALECRVTEIAQPRDLAGNPARVHLVTGQVVGVHIDDAMLVDGIFDIRRARPLARLGYLDYAEIREIFSARRPVYRG
jgi:flavin reductase (DIM6/NTAB) family NADH-FMN oxidoreductase RutF